MGGEGEREGEGRCVTGAWPTCRVGVQSQKALGMIAKMGSILLQIEVRPPHCRAVASSIDRPFSTMQALANDSKQLDLSSLAASVQELGLSVSTRNYE